MQISRAGHLATSNLVNVYLDRAMCRMNSDWYAFEDELDTSEHWPNLNQTLDMPRIPLSGAFSLGTREPRGTPSCRSTNLERNNKLVPLRQQGWREWAWEDKVRPANAIWACALTGLLRNISSQTHQEAPSRSKSMSPPATSSSSTNVPPSTVSVSHVAGWMPRRGITLI